MVKIKLGKMYVAGIRFNHISYCKDNYVDLSEETNLTFKESEVSYIIDVLSSILDIDLTLFDVEKVEDVIVEGE